MTSKHHLTRALDNLLIDLLLFPVLLFVVNLNMKASPVWELDKHRPNIVGKTFRCLSHAEKQFNLLGQS